MDAERWLRPHARVALLLAGLLVGGLWTLMTSFTAYAAVWWPEHAILKNPPTDAFGGMIVLSSIFASLSIFSWLRVRHVTWRVGSEGIAVYRRGQLQRSLGWSEITAMNVRRFGAVVRSAARPPQEEIFWLAGEDVAWLRDVARERLGPRLVS